MKEQKWYYNRGLKPQGPVSYEDLRLLIYKGEVGPHDLISEAETQDWKPASEWKCFESQLFPATQLLIEDSVEDRQEWVLLVHQEGQLQVAKMGPFTSLEIKDLLKQGRCSAQQSYAWKPGLSGWCRLSDREEFLDL